MARGAPEPGVPDARIRTRRSPKIVRGRGYAVAVHSDGGISPDYVPTRLVDLSCLTLHDLAQYDPADVARISARLVLEVSKPAPAALGGSNS